MQAYFFDNGRKTQTDQNSEFSKTQAKFGHNSAIFLETWNFKNIRMSKIGFFCQKLEIFSKTQDFLAETQIFGISENR